MKTLCAAACAFFFLSFHAGAQTYLECDFTEGIPEDFTLIDNDGNTPSASMSELGFAPGVAWIAVAPTNESGVAACSTSWYQPAGQADDWMITPPITVEADNAVLTWKAKAADKRHRDGYAIYVAEGGSSSISEFDTAAPLFSTGSEEAYWTAHKVSLAAYKGKTISLAFVNNSTDQSRLYIDDIFAGVESSAYIKVSLGSATPLQGDIEVSGTVTGATDYETTGFVVGLEYGGKEYTQTFDGTLSSGVSLPFTLDAKLHIGFHETVDYKMWVEADGTRHEISRQITSYPMKVVCDDVTGTWCGFCVRGLVALDNIRQNYADRAIGVAAHSGDVMYDDITYYTTYLASLVPWEGLPAGAMNRFFKCDPGEFVNYIDQMINYEKTYVAIEASAEQDAVSGEFTASTRLWFADSYDDADFRLAYTIIENRVHQPGDDDYKQHNSYSGGDYGEMGGYENLPVYVPSEDMYFDDVVRCTVGDFNGIEGSVPAQIKADEMVEYATTFSLPETVINPEETELVVMVIDQSDKRVVNATKVSLGKSGNGIRQLETNASGTEEKQRYNMAGTRLQQPQKGINIVRLSDGTVRKVAVR